MNRNENNTLDDILSAAKAEFSEKGFQSASLRRIVKNADVTTGAFYGYFKSKEELFDALVGEQYDTLMLSGKDSDLCLYTPYEIPLQILLAVSVPRHGFPYEILPLHPVLSGSLQSSCYYSASISTIPHFLINSDFSNSLYW